MSAPVRGPASRPISEPAVKICGVTTTSDARLAIDCGAAFVGLNFYPKSPRALEVSQARRIREAVAGEARVVGVFVNSPPGEVAAIASEVGLDLLQFHGDEPIAELRPFAQRALRAFRPGPGFDPAEVAEYDDFWGC